MSCIYGTKQRFTYAVLLSPCSTLEAGFQSLYSWWAGPSSMSNALEIRAAPSEMKCYLTHGQALELFPVVLGTNTVSSPPVPLGRCDPTQTLGRFVSCGNKVNSQKHMGSSLGSEPNQGNSTKIITHIYGYLRDLSVLYIQDSTSIFSSWTEYVSYSISSGREQLLSWHCGKAFSAV